jgi:pilus assembly protein CpaE
MILAATKASTRDDEAFQAFVCDSQTTESLQTIVTERGWALDQINSGGVENAIRVLAIEPSPRLLVVDLSDSAQPLEDINALAEVCRPGTMVITVGKANDVKLYRDLLAAGVQDYLVKPVQADDMRDALLNAEMALRAPEESPTQAAPARQEKVISVIGVRGGVGATMVASSCAWLLAHEMDRHVALLDLDLHFGSNALTFDLEPGRGLCDALENPSRVDGLFIERAMIKESDKLSILGAEASLNEPYFPDPAAISHLLSELKQNFQTVIMDVPKIMAAQHPFILSESTEILVVSDLSLAATRDTIRLLALARSVAPQAKITVIANKVAVGPLNEVPLSDFEASIETRIDWQIPLDSKSVVMAAKQGRALAQSAGGSKIVSTLRSLTQKLIGEKAGPAKKSIFDIFLKPAKASE